MTKNELLECQLAIKKLTEESNFDEALPLIYAALEHYPDDAATLHYMGYIY